jgi:pimeloyl-ACP methyl ester carboxylesterase
VERPALPSPLVPNSIGVELGGRHFAGLDWGGRGPDLLQLHPNGFCAGVFDPVARRLTDRYRCLGLDLCGQGASDPPADLDTFTMTDVAIETLVVLDALGLGAGPLHVVGQSLGGVVATLMDRERPGLIDRMVLCEAVVFPADMERPPDRPQMGEIARRRRAVWPDREAMRARFASRPPMDTFAPEALDAYLRYGVVDRPDGQVEVACPPEVEAAVFELTPTGRGSAPAWDHLPHLSARTTIVSGVDTSLPRFFGEQAARAGVPHIEVPGQHLFVQEFPDATAELIAGLLSGADGQ